MTGNDPAVSSGELSGLLKILDLEQLEVNIFRGLSPDETVQRVFGGQVAGQALVAAGRTVPAERHVHSLHAYFLRPGDPTIPIIYEVDRIRDGRSFTTRRVVAVQHGKAIFHLSASFQVEEPGLDHQGEMPDVPDPESLPTSRESRLAAGLPIPEAWKRNKPVLDIRHVEDPPWVRRTDDEVRRSQRVWIRVDGELPDDPLLHVCAATYASDMTLLDSVFLAHNLGWDDGSVMVASLDHAMWFHRPFRADEWMLYDQSTPSASGARGLGIGRLFTPDGRHAVSVVQEGLLRLTHRSR